MGSPIIMEDAVTATLGTCGMWPSTMWPTLMWPTGSPDVNGMWPVCNAATTPFQGCIVLFDHTDIVTKAENLTAIHSTPLSIPIALQDPGGLSSPPASAFVTFPTDLATLGSLTTDIISYDNELTDIIRTATILTNICLDCQSGACFDGN